MERARRGTAKRDTRVDLGSRVVGVDKRTVAPISCIFFD